jgi:hypothetical protein
MSISKIPSDVWHFLRNSKDRTFKFRVLKSCSSFKSRLPLIQIEGSNNAADTGNVLVYRSGEEFLWEQRDMVYLDGQLINKVFLDGKELSVLEISKIKQNSDKLIYNNHEFMLLDNLFITRDKHVLFVIPSKIQNDAETEIYRITIIKDIKRSIISGQKMFDFIMITTESEFVLILGQLIGLIQQNNNKVQREIIRTLMNIPLSVNWVFNEKSKYRRYVCQSTNCFNQQLLEDILTCEIKGHRWMSRYGYNWENNFCPIQFPDLSKESINPYYERWLNYCRSNFKTEIKLIETELKCELEDYHLVLLASEGVGYSNDERRQKDQVVQSFLMKIQKGLNLNLKENLRHHIVVNGVKVDLGEIEVLDEFSVNSLEEMRDGGEDDCLELDFEIIS